MNIDLFLSVPQWSVIGWKTYLYISLVYEIHWPNIAGASMNYVCVKYFQTFSLVAKVVRIFFAGEGRFNYNVVPFKYRWCTFLELYLKITNINFCDLREIFNIWRLFICHISFDFFWSWIDYFMNFKKFINFRPNMILWILIIN